MDIPSKDLLAADLPTFDAAIAHAVTAGALSLGQIVKTVLTGYRDRPALSWRPVLEQGGRRGLASQFSTISYSSLWEQVQSLAATLSSVRGIGLSAGDGVATLGFAGPQYVSINLALLYLGLLSVPVQTSSSIEQLVEIFREVKPRLLAVSAENVQRALSIVRAWGGATTLLVFDVNSDPTAVSAVTKQEFATAELPVSLITFEEAIARGQTLPTPKPQSPAASEDPPCIIFYTSGSTGAPKGAMHGQRRVRLVWELFRSTPLVQVHYQPLSHGLGMYGIFMALANGGRTYFTAKSDLSSLLEDIALSRPTYLMLVPRVCELIYERASAEMKMRPKITMEQLKKELVGDRLLSAATGSAPLRTELKEFVQCLFDVRIDDVYASTEAGLIAINRVIQKPPVQDYRLIDVPESGYFTTDQPHPRGELIIKTTQLIPGYLGSADLNANFVDEHGYYHTGDILEETSPGVIRYLDRRNNVLKLAQGEFVALAQLEAIYSGGHGLLKQVYLYGNAARSYLLGVVVPNMNMLSLKGEDAAIKGQLFAALREVALNRKLKSYEIPRDIIVEYTPFCVENGLLSGVGKYIRPALRERYKHILEARYAEMAAAQERELDNLRNTAGDRPVLETILRGVRTVFGIAQVELKPTSSFSDLGGDSLGAVSLSLLMEDTLGLTVDVGTILDPTSTLASLAERIERMRTDSLRRPIAKSIRGATRASVRASDLVLGAFVPQGILNEASGLELPEDREPRVVLLTGANGYLGRFLCLQWLERFATIGSGTLVCLSRGPDDELARKRLEAAFGTADTRLVDKYQQLAAKHLRVVAGDVASVRLGLSDSRWNELAENVDVIVHCAALVNHKVPYRQLFQPNVVGTAELIALALTRRMKRFVNVSTIAAVLGDAGTIIGEDVDVRKGIPERELNDSYANGYATSKWAGEVLLADAHDRFGLPVCTFRPNMILAHRTYRGQLNVRDTLTRLLLSIALTRLAPESFYVGDREKAHYQGLPVDFVAEAMVALGEQSRIGARNFNVANTNDDGASLDTFVDWLDKEHYRCQRLPYAEWLSRLRTALHALPDHLSQASALPIIEAYCEPASAKRGGEIAASAFLKGLTTAGISEGKVPNLTRALIAKYVSDLRALSLL